MYKVTPLAKPQADKREPARTLHIVDSFDIHPIRCQHCGASLMAQGIYATDDLETWTAAYRGVHLYTDYREPNGHQYTNCSQVVYP